jgi:hypothetical protein
LERESAREIRVNGVPSKLRGGMKRTAENDIGAIGEILVIKVFEWRLIEGCGAGQRGDVIRRAGGRVWCGAD